jgi:hypothetical protein
MLLSWNIFCRKLSNRNSDPKIRQNTLWLNQVFTILKYEFLMADLIALLDIFCLNYVNIIDTLKSQYSFRSKFYICKSMSAWHSLSTISYTEKKNLLSQKKPWVFETTDQMFCEYRFFCCLNRFGLLSQKTHGLSVGALTKFSGCSTDFFFRCISSFFSEIRTFFSKLWTNKNFINK